MIIIAVCLFFSAYGQEDIPFKNSEEFTVYSSFQLVTLVPERRPDVGEKPDRRKRLSNEMFLEVTLQITQVNENEDILRVFNDGGLFVTKRKMKVGTELKFDFGSVEQGKKRENPQFFTIFILDKKKKKTSKIVIEVLDNGALFVNGKPHGKN